MPAASLAVMPAAVIADYNRARYMAKRDRNPSPLPATQYPFGSGDIDGIGRILDIFTVNSNRRDIHSRRQDLG